MIVIEKGNSFSVKDGYKIEINQRSEENFKRLFKELINKGFYPDNILHFWNYDTPHKLTSSQEKLESSFYNSITPRRGFVSARL